MRSSKTEEKTEHLKQEIIEDLKWKRIKILGMTVLSKDTVSILFQMPVSHIIYGSSPVKVSGGQRCFNWTCKEAVEAIISSGFSIKKIDGVEISARVIIGGDTLRALEIDWDTNFPGKNKLALYWVMNS